MINDTNHPTPSDQFDSAMLWLAVMALATAAMVLLARVSGFGVEFEVAPSAKAAAMLGGLTGLTVLYSRISRRCGVALGAFTALLFAGLAGGVLSMIGQTFALPFVDHRLAAADALLGLDAGRIIAATLAVPKAANLLSVVYGLSLLLIATSAFALGCLGRFERAWELSSAFSFCLLVAVLISALFPAAGAYIFYDFSAFADRLPGGAGTYHLEALNELRGSSDLLVNPLQPEGLVTFPSFHTAMALMTAAAWRDDPFLRWPMIAWNGAVIFSTVPIGGHYVVDLIGGAVMWFLFFRYGPAWAKVIRFPRSVAGAKLAAGGVLTR